MNTIDRGYESMGTLDKPQWDPQTINAVANRGLADSGIRPTSTRWLVYDVFEQNKTRSLGCLDVYHLLVKANFSVKLTSVYSSVRTLVAAGILVRCEPRKGVRLRQMFSWSPQPQETTARRRNPGNPRN